jgi:hypothetical protein
MIPMDFLLLNTTNMASPLGRRGRRGGRKKGASGGSHWNGIDLEFL